MKIVILLIIIWIIYKLFRNLLSDETYKNFKNLFDGNVNSNFVIKKMFSFIKIAGIVLLIILSIDIFIINSNYNISDFGAFGDFMGGILNPIFMFLTLFALIITLIIQRQELRLSREEYKKTSNSLSTQAIENTFFNILDLHHKITENIKININELELLKDESKVKALIKKNSALVNSIALTSLTISGLKFFDYEKQKQKEFTDEEGIIIKGNAAFDVAINFISYETKEPKEMLKRYKRLQDDANHIFGHYFRNLYQALKLIDRMEKKDEIEKRKYASILRAQLSANELTLLFLNSLDNICDEGQFRNLIIKYQLLEHLPLKKIGARYLLSNRIFVSKDMINQYLNEINIIKKDIKKENGAFGSNNLII